MKNLKILAAVFLYGILLLTVACSTSDPAPAPTPTTNVAARLSSISTTGFVIIFDVAVPGLVATDLALDKEAKITSLKADETNKTYTVVTSALTGGTAYALTITKGGYAFTTSPLPFTAPKEDDVKLTGKISATSATGFILTFDQPIAGLAPTEVKLDKDAKVTSLTGDTANKVFTVITSTLTAGTIYTVTLAKTGFALTNTLTVTFTLTENIAVVAGITNPSPTGFTLTFDPAVAGLLGTDIAISGGASITSATPNTGNTAYTVLTSTTLTAGTNYAVTLTKTGYTFTGTLTFTAVDPAVTPPTIPTMLIAHWASAAATADLTLSWGAVTGATSYKVYKDAVLVATVTTNTSTITGASATGVYTVSAANAGGESAKASVFSTMMLVTAGTFTMGQVDIAAANPAHSVTLTKAYYMSKTEVTFAQYDAFCDALGKQKPSDNGWGRGTRPVINVTWDNAVAYTTWISDKTGKTYRLPTEAEWEYACRAGTTTPYNTGDALTTAQANFGGAQTVAVGSYLANAWGLQDMHGNVWEWCSDWYVAYGSEAQSDPAGPATGNNRIYRGGGWGSTAGDCRSAYRYSNTPDSSLGTLGFRVVIPQ